ncbi:hypothetical protein EV702DRAFT_1084879 [Suillus placidus]|uniref:Cytochrome P450 n=1 Tax=Suillus placidus TaxID=48579 RepID=A0A9P6ZZP0_9AGAM|nr:hypothetical protein EV702DRAFT_1084879 [Suillus placidus]
MSFGIIILFVAAATVFFYSRQRGRLPLPPGPPPKLFIGNAHQLPKNEPWRAYVTWAEIYGTHCPIFRLLTYISYGPYSLSACPTGSS